MEINILPMTLSDLDHIASILESDFDDFWNYQILKSEIQNNNSVYICCKDLNNNVLGFAGITIILDNAELNNIVVKKKYRGKGLSSMLLEELIKISREKNCKTLNLEVSEINSIALNLYKKFGFEQVGYRKKYYNGKDAILFTKKL